MTVPTLIAESRANLARTVAAAVTDPEMPMLTLEDLGVLRDVRLEGDAVIVTITPTYSGCPAMATMRDDLAHALADRGFEQVEIRVSLHPAWSTDWITPRGRAALRDAGISAPSHVGERLGPVPLSLTPTRRALHCPRCDSTDVAITSEFGATACKALYRCNSCLEPFEHVKEI
ncbi:1,2-phenylacetyl-CoA epoxidase subunit PaaD [Marmoricola sp. RAF53]|uniref:1,2-phenylacetyl-CoA epoxidase subunit PaaD n=1 Tax=Marmoricola sp. RAF53 TaxID=3233059 RepID=UPI003F9C63A0